MPESVLVIGCGPGGMFFCHALETKRRALAGNPEQLAALPNVTVMERAGSPGGVWRSARNHDNNNNNPDSELAEEKKESDGAATESNHGTQMYEALWTNGPKEGIEFFDYTYDEHFGRQLPVYMPRQPILEYMIARVVKNCPDFFDRYVQFLTAVQNVIWTDAEQKFTVTSHNTLTGQTATQKYDKCIWAAGDQGLPYMPQALLQKLDGFNGKIIHSTDTANFGDDVRGKRILIVGGSYSAEDLALVACKVGVEKAYIVTRCDDSAVTWTKQWPGDKVELLLKQTPMAVESGSTILMQKLKWVIDSQYENEEGAEPGRLENIDTIVLCTGYRRQFDMLAPELTEWKKGQHTNTFPVPEDWTMAENSLTPLLGDVPPPKEARYFGTFVAWSDLYRGVLIDNPNMMFLRTDHDDYPILVIDSNAWLLMQIVTGGRPLPSAEGMKKENIDQALFEMKHYPQARYFMDQGYCEKYTALQPESDPTWKLYEEAEAKSNRYDFQVLARTMQEGKHPANIGTYEALNEQGETLHDYGYLSYYHRCHTTTNTTFRDVKDASKFKSRFTGTESVPLKELWMDLDENTDKNLV
eukprot:CAMPEP_0119004116 /NCGR_PEP_ID=MMETSP1176-20130426/961_1 /TAXON_ID=265551 /ORGANISM="Synedropsis recta cf, Strain CCMP1620" /LENGTH=582 /DNA_ID=CAMNT_0006955789 /DNA_START=150 /DNA_END=1898 /DNA_ORIENTATION=-